MIEKQSLALRLFEIECEGLVDGAAHWSLQAYLDEMDQESAEIFLWPHPENFSAFVLYRVLPFQELWVMNWAVSEKGRGQGTQVFDAFMDFCREQGFEKIGLELRSTNAAALKIYKNAGFELVGRRQNYYSNGDEAMVFMTSLNKAHD
jgi:ribosomal-protein-alanine N-acetyltransferase